MPEGVDLVADELNVSSLGSLISLSSGDFIRASDYKSGAGNVIVVGAGGAIGRTIQAANTSAPAVTIGRVGAGAGSAHYSDAAVYATDNTLIAAPDNSLRPRFLYHFLRSVDWRPLRSGSAQPLINQSAVKGLNIPVFPLDVQDSISQLIDSADGRRSSAITHITAARRAIERFRQAVLAAACSGRLTAEWRSGHGVLSTADSNGVPAGWRWTTFGEVCQRVTVGHVGKMVNEYQAEGIPFLRSLNVRELRFEPQDLKFVSRAFHDRLSKSSLHPGDIVVVRSGLVGTACVIPSDLKEANCSDLVIARPGPDLVPEFGAIYVNAPQMKAHISNVKVGSTQAHFNTRSMQTAPLLAPPVEEQYEIVRMVHGLLAMANRLLAQTERASRSIERSAQAVLAKAFRGDLVPAEADTAVREPAAVLSQRSPASVPTQRLLRRSTGTQQATA